MANDEQPVLAEPPSLYLQERSIISFSDMVSKGPYRPRVGLALDTVERLVFGMFKFARDHMWNLREDPLYFKQSYQNIEELNIDWVRDHNGKPGPNVERPRLVDRTLRTLVLEAYYDLICKEQLHQHIVKLNELSTQYPAGIDTEHLQPTEFVETAQTIISFLYLYRAKDMQSLRQYPASPSFREFFTRTQEEDKPPTLESKLSTEADQAGKTRLSVMLDWGTEGLVPGCGTDFRSLHLGPDLLDTLLRKTPECKEYLTTRIERDITELSIVAACDFELELKPWYCRVYNDAAQVEDGFTRHLDKSLGRWLHLFDDNIEDLLITSPQLGDPCDGKFKYPVNRSRSQHKTVNLMCKDEANPDIFWRHVDLNIQKYADREE